MYKLLCSVLWGLSAGAALAQTAPTGITVTYPSSRAVFQRDNDNTSTLYFSGTYYQPIDSVQARLIAEVVGQGINTNWVTVQRNPQGGVVQGAIRGTGGWYRLQVRAFRSGQVIDDDEVRKVGIGEVFIITGQSNAQGLNTLGGQYTPGNNEYGAVGAADDRVNCVTYNNLDANSLADPPAPTFEQLTATSIIGPRGVTAWCWGRLGDLLAQQYNVPVLFMNTAWGGTTIRNWVESAQGQRTANIYTGAPLPNQMPYANLRIALRYYSSIQGLRAVLWHQGETDNIPLRLERDEYRRLMQTLIDRTRGDTQRYPAWLLARASRTSYFDPACLQRCAGNEACNLRCPLVYEVSDKVTGGQTDIVNNFDNNVFGGPFTDNIQPNNRIDGVHFSGDGLTQLAQAWYQSMSPTFFAAAVPLLPLPPPTVTVECANNNSVTITLPMGYQSYEWQTGQTGRTINVSQPGRYQAKVRNAANTVFLSPTIDIRGPIQPPTPTLSVARTGTAVAANQQQICADSVLTLTANVSPQSAAQWSNGVTTTTLRAANAGNYSAQAVNTFGCRSAASPSVNLIVRPRLATPTIEQAGIYSLQATLPGYPNNERFDWRRGTAFLNNQNGPVAKAVISGSYTARAKAVFTLSNGDALTCYSTFSNEIVFTSAESADGVSVYPNPSVNGYMAIETIEDLQNAALTIHSLNGQLLYSEAIPSFNTRRLISVAGFAAGQYIVRVKAEGFDVARRVFITR